MSTVVNVHCNLSIKEINTIVLSCSIILMRIETKGFPLPCGLMSVVNMSASDKYGKGSHSLPR